MDKATQLVWGLKDGVVGIVQQPLSNDTITVLAVVGIVAGCFLIAHLFDKHSRRQWLKKRGLIMARGERGQYIRVKVADKVTDGIEDLVIRGEISGQEANQQYRMLARYLDNEELAPRKLHKEAVKARLKKLIAQRKQEASVTPAIPGPKPGEGTPLPENVTSFGAAALARKRKVA